MEIWENRDLKDLEGEIWKDIENYNGDYEISNLGRVKSFKKCRGINIRILQQIKSSTGYLFIKLSKNRKCESKLISHLVYETFGEKLKENECIHHINENKYYNIFNNLKKMDNFEHNSSHKSGENHPFYGKKRSDFSGINNPMFGKTGENCPNHKLTEQEVIQIKLLIKEGILTLRKIAKIFEVHESTISDIKNRRSWKYIKI